MSNTKILKNSQKQQSFLERLQPQLWLQWSHFGQQHQNSTCTAKLWLQKQLWFKTLTTLFGVSTTAIMAASIAFFQQNQITQKKKEKKNMATSVA